MKEKFVLADTSNAELRIEAERDDLFFCSISVRDVKTVGELDVPFVNRFLLTAEELESFGEWIAKQLKSSR